MLTAATVRPLIVTRPQPEAERWAAQLQAHGLAAQALPLMEIGPSHSSAALQAVHHALQQLTHYRAVMFVSANAVRHFFSHPAWQAHAALPPAQWPHCWSPGPGTTQALELAGIPASGISAPAAHAPQFDSESLWAQVQHQLQPADRVLIVRGDDADSAAPSATGRGRAWLSQQLQAQQVLVDFAPVYTRYSPAPEPVLLSRITALHTEASDWLFSSSECIRNLCALAPTLSWAGHTALATHPRIAAQARQAGFGRVLQTRPTLLDIAASIKSAA